MIEIESTHDSNSFLCDCHAVYMRTYKYVLVMHIIDRVHVCAQENNNVCIGNNVV